MNWRLSHRFDPAAVSLADRHYNRQKPGTPQFVPPGRCLVFKALGAAWVSSWPYAEYTKHAWAGAWINTFFRNERRDLYLSSDLITQAIAATKSIWHIPPPLGLITFIDTKKVRRKRDYGRCYRKAGFVEAGYTKGGLLALQLLPDKMPEAQEPIGLQRKLVLV